MKTKYYNLFIFSSLEAFVCAIIKIIVEAERQIEQWHRGGGRVFQNRWRALYVTITLLGSQQNHPFWLHWVSQHIKRNCKLPLARNIVNGLLKLVAAKKKYHSQGSSSAAADLCRWTACLVDSWRAIPLTNRTNSGVRHLRPIRRRLVRRSQTYHVFDGKRITRGPAVSKYVRLVPRVKHVP